MRTLIRGSFHALGPVAPGLMAGVAEHLFRRTRRRPRREADGRLLASARRERSRLGGHQVAVYRWGSTGPIALLMHGWNGSTADMGAFVAPLQAAGYQVVGFDAPGHGASAGTSSSIFEVAAVAVALQERVGAVSGIVAHSFGGMCATYALRNGLSAERVVCIGAPADLGFLLDNFANLVAMPKPVMHRFRDRLEQRFGPDLWERLSSSVNARDLGIPALIIHDHEDRVVPLQQGRRLADAWPGAQLHATRGLGHSRVLRDAGTVALAVDFLRGPSREPR